MICRSLLIATALTFSVAGCTGETETSAPPLSVTAQTTQDPFAAYPAVDSTQAIEPIDPAISPDAAAIDERAGELETRSRTLDPEQSGWEPRVVRGWFDDGRLVRLSVSEPTDAGAMSGETIFYLSNAQPFVVRTSDGVYKVDTTWNIVEWLDVDGSMKEVPADLRTSRARELRAAFERWNAALSSGSRQDAT